MLEIKTGAKTAHFQGDPKLNGQAIAFDRGAKGVLFGVNRKQREVVGFKLPPPKAFKNEGP